MTEQEFLLQLARALTRREDLLSAKLRPQLLEILLRIRALLLTSFAPAGSAPLRSFLYAQLRQQILALLQPLVTTYYTNIRAALPPLYADLLRVNAQLFAVPLDRLTTPPLNDLLTTSTVLNRSARALLAPTATGISPLTLQLERLLDTTVQAAILRDEPVERISSLLLTGSTARPTIRKGTVANAWLDRLTATTSALLWSLTVPAQQATAAASDETITGWRWNAVLDPKTCPLCRPLHGRVEKEPTDFPHGPPNVHPRCRCVLIPIFA
jgi:SPP1 gp7 family putative phage head morphogenesis protein